MKRRKGKGKVRKREGQTQTEAGMPKLESGLQNSGALESSYCETRNTTSSTKSYFTYNMWLYPQQPLKPFLFSLLWKLSMTNTSLQVFSQHRDTLDVYKKQLYMFRNKTAECELLIIKSRLQDRRLLFRLYYYITSTIIFNAVHWCWHKFYFYIPNKTLQKLKTIYFCFTSGPWHLLLKTLTSHHIWIYIMDISKQTHATTMHLVTSLEADCSRQGKSGNNQSRLRTWVYHSVGDISQRNFDLLVLLVLIWPVKIRTLCTI